MLFPHRMQAQAFFSDPGTQNETPYVEEVKMMVNGEWRFWTSFKRYDGPGKIRHTYSRVTALTGQA